MRVPRSKAAARAIAWLAATLATLGVVACGGDQGSEERALPQGSEPVELDPAEFTTEIDNPY